MALSAMSGLMSAHGPNADIAPGHQPSNPVRLLKPEPLISNGESAFLNSSPPPPADGRSRSTHPLATAGDGPGR